MCYLCECVDCYDQLPPWNAVQKNNNRWKGIPGLHYWHAEKQFRVIAYRNGRHVYFARACDECGGQTKNQNSAICAKKMCGGDGERTTLCTHVDIEEDGRIIRCSIMAHHHSDGDRLCRPHYCAKHPHLACTRCAKRPYIKRLASKLCFSCHRKRRNEAARHAKTETAHHKPKRRRS